ncbi:hypothetical protein GCM10011361_02000 [Muriicola marianensis]|uniref:Uncharacterized protein n=1 Tax=Muriicola marianensis TaxID=1324801 RepID=A0ABQ1QRW2_9FLAO|nr:hypothetical protein GCM10011361_02000 [Muriicola marianensis]
MHQVHAAQGVVKAGVVGPRKHKVGHAHLGDPSQALEIRMGNEIKKPVGGNSNKSVNWIVK